MASLELSVFEKELRKGLLWLFKLRIKDFKIHEVFVSREYDGRFCVILVVDEWPPEDVEDRIDDILEFIEDEHDIVLDTRFRFTISTMEK